MRALLFIALTVSAPLLLLLTAGCASRSARAPAAPQPRSGEAQSAANAAARRPADPRPDTERNGIDRTDDGVARADDVNARLSRLWASRNRKTLVETLHIQFRPDREELDDGAQTALRGLLQELKRNENLVVNLEGYTDMLGSRDHNLELSRRRADAVRLYLVEHGVELWRIHAIGRGPLTDPAVPAQRKRRVTIKVIAPSE